MNQRANQHQGPWDRAQIVARGSTGLPLILLDHSPEEAAALARRARIAQDAGIVPRGGFPPVTGFRRVAAVLRAWAATKTELLP
jgi:hypothetical protein